jgi:hypothetical protein
MARPQATLPKTTGAAGANAAGDPPPPPPAPPPPKAKATTRDFVALVNVRMGGETVAPGAKVALTRDVFDALKAQGAIEGEWGD